MRFAVAFLFLGAAWVALAAWYRGWAWLYLWPGVSFLVVGTAYARLGPRVLGKRPDGTIAPWAVVLLLPYFVLAWVAWFLAGALARPATHHQVAPGIWVGRRTGALGLPDGVGLVVDLTSEFWEPAGVRKCDGREYVCVPSLDHSVPDERSFRDLVRRVAECGEGRHVYIHCAQGYGRAATVAAAVLIVKGLAADVGEAERILKQARPGVRLGRRQRQMVERVTRVPGVK
jgi:protein-tyrosine phosphatase